MKIGNRIQGMMMLTIGIRLVMWITVTWFVFIQPALAQSEVVPFAEQARAVFKKRCVSCHSQSQARGGLDMTSLEGILAGSNSGSVVEPGKPEESLVYTLPAHQDTPKMPPNAPRIPQRELNAISMWIKSLTQHSSVPETGMKSVAAFGEDVSGSVAIVDGLVDVEPVSGPLAITALASSKSLLAVSGLRQVLLFDTSTEQLRGALNFPEGDVFALKFTADGDRLIAAGGVGGLSGHVVCWDLASYRRIANLSFEGDEVLAMDVSPDGKLLAVGGPKRVIEVIELASSTKRHILRKHADWVTQLAFSPDGVFLASSDRFGGIYLWDVVGGAEFDTVTSHSAAVTGLQFSQDSNRLWSAGKDGQVQQWDLQLRKIDQRWPVSTSGIASLLLSGEQVLTVDNQHRLTVYATNGKMAVQHNFEHELTNCAIIESNPLRLVLADQQSGLHWLCVGSDVKARSTLLPQKTKSFVVSPIAARPVDRQLRASSSAKSKDDPTETVSREAAIIFARKAIDTSRGALETTKQSLEELESKILELEQMLDRLERE